MQNLKKHTWQAAPWSQNLTFALSYFGVFKVSRCEAKCSFFQEHFQTWKKVHSKKAGRLKVALVRLRVAEEAFFHQTVGLIAFNATSLHSHHKPLAYLGSNCSENCRQFSSLVSARHRKEHFRKWNQDYVLSCKCSCKGSKGPPWCEPVRAQWPKITPLLSVLLDCPLLVGYCKFTFITHNFMIFMVDFYSFIFRHETHSCFYLYHRPSVLFPLCLLLCHTEQNWSIVRVYSVLLLLSLSCHAGRQADLSGEMQWAIARLTWWDQGVQNPISVYFANMMESSVSFSETWCCCTDWLKRCFCLSSCLCQSFSVLY